MINRVVLMGRLARYLGLDATLWLDAIKTTVAPKFVEMNLAAFKAGYEA